MRMTVFLSGLPLRSILPHPNYEEKQQIPIEEHPAKCLTSTSQNCQGYQKRDISKETLIARGAQGNN